jgi:WD40 repeat protein
MPFPTRQDKVQRTCPRCGFIFSSSSEDGLCPACLLASALDQAPPGEPAFWEEAVPPRAQGGRTFSHFELLDELGRGGMGVVYRARDLNTERIVAIKVLQAHHLEVPDLVRRFRSEVRAVSSLDHPHVLPIHEVGESDGIPFFSMKLTTGQSLAHRLGNYLGKPRDAAQLLSKVARGVQHAHARGILHRDLKPGNILLDSAGEPFVCDFGLAKWLDDDTKLTVTAAVLGTPHYIAPEQAKGSKALTTAVDIYSLGAILYELLTGRPPFIGGSALQTLIASQEKSPERPSSLARNVPRDLETICLKALQFDPAARYVTAESFADDLDNWLEGRPINARPVSAAEQLWRWAKRNPTPAVLLTVLVLLISAIAVGSTVSAVKIDKARKRALTAESEAVSARRLAEDELFQSLIAQARAARLTGTSGQRFDAVNAIAHAAKIHDRRELRDEAIAALTLHDLRIRERWKVRANPLKEPLRFNKELTRLYVGSESGAIRILDLADRRQVGLLADNSSPVTSLCSSGSTYLAVRHADQTVDIWDCVQQRRVHRFTGFPITSRTERWAYDSAFSSDEARFAIARKDGDILIFDTRSWEQVRTLQTGGNINVLQFSPDGDYLAVADTRRPILELWHLTDASARPRRLELPSICLHLEWSPKGATLGAGCIDFSVYLIDASSGKISAPLQGHNQEVTQIAFDPIGSLLASTSRDSSIKLWDVRNQLQLVSIPGIGGEAGLMFSKDSNTIATTDFQSDALLLEIGGNDKILHMSRSFAPHDFAALVASVSFSSDGSLVATSGFRSVELWDGRRAEHLATLATGDSYERTVRFLDGSHLLVASTGRPPVIYDVSTPEAPRIPENSWGNHPDVTGSLGSAFFGQRALSLTDGTTGTVSLYNAANGTLLSAIEGQVHAWDAITSPEGDWTAVSFSGQGSENVRVIQSTGLRELPTGSASTLAANHDATILVTTGMAGTQVWNTRDWSRIAMIPTTVDTNSITTAAFSPDDRMLAVSIGDSICLIDTARPTLLCRLSSKLLSSQEYRVAFSPDGKTLAAQGQDGSLRLWDLQMLQQHLAKLGLAWNTL